jgi:hypothetical protein
MGRRSAVNVQFTAESCQTVVILDTASRAVVGSCVPMTKRFLTTAAVLLVLAAGVADARAEIVFLTSGRSVSVKGHRIDGDRIILSLRTGGEVACDRTLVEKIVPDEVPYPEPAPITVPEKNEKDQAPAGGGLLPASPYRPTGWIRCSSAP